MTDRRQARNVSCQIITFYTKGVTFLAHIKAFPWQPSQAPLYHTTPTSLCFKTHYTLYYRLSHENLLVHPSERPFIVEWSGFFSSAIVTAARLRQWIYSTMNSSPTRLHSRQHNNCCVAMYSQSGQAHVTIHGENAVSHIALSLHSAISTFSPPVVPSTRYLSNLTGSSICIVLNDIVGGTAPPPIRQRHWQTGYPSSVGLN
ncbi:hypothetical protein F4820DRAFT_225661 [Hypoxylon rubiginosum]|uniref:Uncharacterized protein n=1 Tax=Hypoxylon rubiginosum TaxID=110542 RepID=A0ACB9Z846_9PEZI|nr:hypothetical protein F4820DRAFT_225661 [Hypoxylon rubiginosum]